MPMTCGFGYTAFVVDAYAGLIAGWECSLTKDTGFVERALRHAAATGPGEVIRSTRRSITPIMPRFALSRGSAEMACSRGSCWWISRLNVSGVG